MCADMCCRTAEADALDAMATQMEKAAMSPAERAAAQKAEQLAAMSPAEREAALASMPAADKATILAAMSREDRDQTLAAMSPEDRAAAMAAVNGAKQGSRGSAGGPKGAVSPQVRFNEVNTHALCSVDDPS